MSDLAENVAEVAPVTEHVVEQETSTDDWKQSFGVADNPNFEKFETPADLAKSYNELSSMVGRSVRIPTEDASVEDMAAFTDKLQKVPGVVKVPGEDDADGWNNLYGVLGRPSTADGYSLPEVEGANIDAESVGAFKQAAYDAGLTGEQATKLHGWLSGNLAEEALDKATVGERAMAELKGEWGQAFDTKVAGAQNAAKILEERVPGIGEFFDQMAESGYDASFVRLMDSVNEMLGEGTPITSAPRNVMTREEAAERIRDIRSNPNHPAMNPEAPGHDEARLKLMEMYKAKSGAA